MKNKMTKAQAEHWDKRPRIKKLDQRVIDAYEGFIPKVYDAIRFVKEGSGKKYHGAFDMLVRVIAEEERDMWRNLEKAVFSPKK
jgi:hypothetical protein